VANPGETPVRERLMVRNAHLMDDTPMVDVLGQVPKPVPVTFGPGFVVVDVPPKSVLVLQPKPKPLGGYNRNKRVP
jgi:hypothetical protein